MTILYIPDMYGLELQISTNDTYDQTVWFQLAIDFDPRDVLWFVAKNEPLPNGQYFDQVWICLGL